MKNKIYTTLVALVCGLSILSAANVTSATVTRHCKWVPGHYYHGHYVPGKKVCWTGGKKTKRCKWVGGYTNKNGKYIPKHKVCYSRS